MITFTEEEKDMFSYLEILRQSGVTNMFGAAPYLENEFNLSSKEARRVLGLWMDNYDDLVINYGK